MPMRPPGVAPLALAAAAVAAACVVAGGSTQAIAGAGEVECGSHGEAAGGAAACPGRGANCTGSLPSRCGVCAGGTCNEELGRCDCPPDKLDCAGEQPAHRPPAGDARAGEPMCLNGCLGRGRCVVSFCACDPGYWGADCSLAMSASDGTPHLPDDTWRGHRPSPRVFVYDLPAHLGSWFDLRRLDRPAEVFFHERLLTSHHRTADPEAADLFLIPLPTRLSGQIYAKRGQVLLEAVRHVKEKWPYYDRKGGRDHVAFFTGDWGPCEFFQHGSIPELIKDMIFLSFWGLRVPSSRYQGNGPCHNPSKDVVIPPIQSMNGREHSPYHPDGLAGAAAPPVVLPDYARREHVLYFAGSMGQKIGYTVRRKVHDAVAHLDGFKVVEHDDAYERSMANSVFCLAPTGAGWGRRTSLAAMYGCIPVVVQDDVSQPFEETLDYDSFSVRVAEADVEKIPQILAEVPRECDGGETRCVAEMQRQLACATRHFMWTSVYGSAFGEPGDLDAFATTMFALQQRVVGHAAAGEGGEKPAPAPLVKPCDMAEAMGCMRTDTPVCRFPCARGRGGVRSSGMLWTPGGAVCKPGEEVSGGLCA